MKYIIVIALLILMLLAVFLGKRYPPRYSSEEWKLGRVEGEFTIEELVFEAKNGEYKLGRIDGEIYIKKLEFGG